MAQKEKPFSLGILVGRFQTIHAGHELMIETALSLCKQVGIFVGSSQEAGTAQNPFSYETRVVMVCWPSAPWRTVVARPVLRKYRLV